MEPVSLTVGAVVAALVAKAGDRAVATTVEGGEGVLRALINRVRRRFSDSEDGAGAEALALVQRAPDSPSLVGELAATIDRHAAADASFAAELEGLVQRARDAGLSVGSITQVADGDQATQIAAVTGSQINVTHGWRPDKPAA